MIIVTLSVFLTLYIIWINIIYKKGCYYQITHNSHLKTIRDIGLYGEYLTYNALKSHENEGGKFLFNLYVPKHNGQTTEIDLILILKEGIFVFESKNYSGWIFGTDTQPYWTQTLSSRKGKSMKSKFYNPIMQNRSHIKHLKEYLGTSAPFYSVIVFSDRCTFKKLTLNSGDYHICHRKSVNQITRDIQKSAPLLSLSESQIKTIYDRLYPFTQITSEQKEAHIEQNKKFHN